MFGGVRFQKVLRDGENLGALVAHPDEPNHT
jgi:hypothetical protein